MDPVSLGTISPDQYSYLASWNRGKLTEAHQSLWYKLDATGSANDAYLHWKNSWYHDGVGPSELYTVDVWFTVYDEHMEELWSEDKVWSSSYDDAANRNSGCKLDGGAYYYLEVEGYRDSATGVFYFYAVQES